MRAPAHPAPSGANTSAASQASRTLALDLGGSIRGSDVGRCVWVIWLQVGTVGRAGIAATPRRCGPGVECSARARREPARGLPVVRAILRACDRPADRARPRRHAVVAGLAHHRRCWACCSWRARPAAAPRPRLRRRSARRGHGPPSEARRPPVAPRCRRSPRRRPPRPATGDPLVAGLLQAADLPAGMAAAARRPGRHRLRHRRRGVRWPTTASGSCPGRGAVRHAAGHLGRVRLPDAVPDPGGRRRRTSRPRCPPCPRRRRPACRRSPPCRRHGRRDLRLRPRHPGRRAAR